MNIKKVLLRGTLSNWNRGRTSEIFRVETEVALVKWKSAKRNTICIIEVGRFKNQIIRASEHSISWASKRTFAHCS